jgi:hypothetical protein
MTASTTKASWVPPWWRKRRMHLVCGIILDRNGDFRLMSLTQSIPLVNVANPALATRYLGVLDIANGTVVPNIVSSDTTKLAVVVGTLTDGKLAFGCYPVDAQAETNDAVTVTASLAGQPDIVLNFAISGTPLPPPETDTLDASSAVGSWAGAPAVPATPV